MLSKKINKAGGITIPSQLRREFGVSSGTALDIDLKDDGIFITKHAPTCYFCGSQDHVIDVNEIGICKNCSDDIVRRFNLNATNTN